MHADQAKPSPTLPETDKIGDDDICQGDDPSGSNSLNAAANEHCGEVVPSARDDRADSEEDQGDENHLLSAENVTHTCQRWLEADVNVRPAQNQRNMHKEVQNGSHTPWSIAGTTFPPRKPQSPCHEGSRRLSEELIS